MLTPTEVVYAAYGMPLLSDSFTAHNGSCALCRRPLKGEAAVPIENVIKPTFTNRDLLSPTSRLICVACAFCLRTPELRRRDFVASTQKIEFLDREQLRRKLLEPVDEDGLPFVFCVGLSHKKHLILMTRVNISKKLFYVQFETQGVWIQPSVHNQLFFSLQALRKHFSKEEIAEGFYDPSKLKADMLALEEKVKPYRGRPIFNLLLHVA